MRHDPFPVETLAFSWMFCSCRKPFSVFFRFLHLAWSSTDMVSRSCSQRRCLASRSDHGTPSEKRVETRDTQTEFEAMETPELDTFFPPRDAWASFLRCCKSTGFSGQDPARDKETRRQRETEAQRQEASVATKAELSVPFIGAGRNDRISETRVHKGALLKPEARKRSLENTSLAQPRLLIRLFLSVGRLLSGL